jgi:excisionase family DNA binding protein
MKEKENALQFKEVLSTIEAARIINVTQQTIKNYIYSGKLKAVKTPCGHHRIRRSDLWSLGFTRERGRTERAATEESAAAYTHLFEQYVATIETLMGVLDDRDTIRSGHSSRVASLSCAVGAIMRFTQGELRDLNLTALLHDVGKLGVSENILRKPGRLTDQEYFVVKKHPEIGEKILGKVELLQPLAPGIRQSHERYDGRGYPDGVAGTAIDVKARIIAVADTYDYLRSDLAYRRALSHDDSIREIKSVSGRQFDPRIVTMFCKSFSAAGQEEQLYSVPRVFETLSQDSIRH